MKWLSSSIATANHSSDPSPILNVIQYGSTLLLFKHWIELFREASHISDKSNDSDWRKILHMTPHVQTDEWTYRKMINDGQYIVGIRERVLPKPFSWYHCILLTTLKLRNYPPSMIRRSSGTHYDDNVVHIHRHFDLSTKDDSAVWNTFV